MNKKIVGTIGFVSTVFVAVLFNKLLSNREIPKFSAKWFESLSDDELETEREEIRQQYCSPEYNVSDGNYLFYLLQIFDREMRKRALNGSEDYGFPKHSEHGWHLPSDD